MECRSGGGLTPAKILLAGRPIRSYNHSKPGGIMHTLFQDLRFALRTLRKNMMLTVVIVASLAIGIGANSAIFSVVDALLLRPLPYPQPDRLAAVWLHSPAIGILRDWPSPGEYIDVQNENHSGVTTFRRRRSGWESVG